MLEIPRSLKAQFQDSMALDLFRLDIDEETVFLLRYFRRVTVVRHERIIKIRGLWRIRSFYFYRLSQFRITDILGEFSA